MFSFEGFVRLNAFLTGFYRIAYLNILWVAVTLAGLVIAGIGPASYALSAYIDRWFRLGETPPITRAFVRHARAALPRASALGAILTVATGIVVANIFWQTSWILQFANVAALGVLALAWGFGFSAMAATDVGGVARPVAAGLLVAVGSLHWTILASTAAAAACWALASFAPFLLPFFGVGIPAAAVGFVTRIAYRQIGTDAEPSPSLSPALRNDALASSKGTAR
ncbi:YesL family protein [Microbacterium excoecariae]|uniref:YesL family protein n=1 Tax=Microbacterium excoecariae TaxID=2715210 RepID=UPI00140844C3|nr:DUF624 domain-containing protein [Microbacterium excoecariae]NHI17394.1 DUF624 domain-containing protein [Microbacterium excoecariae]